MSPNWVALLSIMVQILFDIAKNKGPEKSLVILGYSGWGSGQLEGEMERDHWILSNIDLNILFESQPNDSDDDFPPYLL